jgi:four helix bundle protein
MRTGILKGGAMRTSRLRTAREIEARDIEEVSFEFGVAILRLVRQHEADLPKSVAENLVMRGTSIGAAVAEAQASGRRRNALSRMMAARQASQETEYWLRLVSAADLVPTETAETFLDEIQGLQSTLTSICMKLRQALEAEGK